MSTNYFNTTHLTGEELSQAIQAASKDEDKIMVLYKSTPDNSYTPCEVHDLIRSMGPITSTRRAMTNLTTKLKLIKTREQRLGVYGKMNYTWALPGYIAKN